MIDRRYVTCLRGLSVFLEVLRGELTCRILCQMAMDHKKY